MQLMQIYIFVSIYFSQNLSDVFSKQYRQITKGRFRSCPCTLNGTYLEVKLNVHPPKGGNNVPKRFISF